MVGGSQETVRQLMKFVIELDLSIVEESQASGLSKSEALVDVYQVAGQEGLGLDFVSQGSVDKITSG